MSCCTGVSNQLFYTAKRSRVRATHPTARSNEISIMQALVVRGSRPRNGWTASLTIKGADVEIRGATPGEVFTKAWSVAKNNDLEVSHKTLWLNLNLQWVANTREQDRLTSMDELLNVAEAGEIHKNDRKTSMKPTDLVRRYLDTAHAFVEAGLTATNISSSLLAFEHVAAPHNTATGDAKVFNAIRACNGRIHSQYRFGKPSAWYEDACKKLADQYEIPLMPLSSK